ncbi:hypothetical protein ACKI1I_04365 [Streptomyces turgidiscabies]|uniref:Uncharacterized protein n=1 Tax=Streptomyces turgidiscabies (strain Car8) TaxID=698760 RepID=L7FDQ7_STRT8|nr:MULTISPECIES: hypothetical protein [Streptomyces]ELP69309.1 hypothetical protein STRTUCAR8_08682 [Streptomyces turgidiscabies Car8]MDX3494934.1 hypothetical protein [Streptomyces turgidiscabies]GAQ70807.1 hypothetical protein T45_02548 [Streptomyces turgidiscabies]
MLTGNAYEDTHPSYWPRVRQFAVPPSMIDTATARRLVGDWAGACAAAGVDVDLNLRAVARAHGHELAARLRADLRHLAPDLLRWHLPRIAPDGLLRPGLTIGLARYDTAGRGARPVHLVARTAPAWADAGQRLSLALWDWTLTAPATRRHPHPHPDRRFRLDLHRHLWDARRTAELRTRSGADRPPGGDLPAPAADLLTRLPQGRRCAVDRWAAEAELLLRADGRPTVTGIGTAAGAATGSVTVRLGARRRLLLDLVAAPAGGAPPSLRITEAPSGDAASALPVLPDAATWVLPDLELIRTGAIEADRLHPLVASALVPDRPPTRPPRAPGGAGEPSLVECRGARHRIGLVDGVLVPLDHDPAEIRREELLAELTGTPLPCLQAIDEAHRHPDCLTGVRERLDHGDIAGALAVVEGLLGPEAVLRGGALRDALERAAERRITYGLFRAGLTGPGPHPGRGGFHPDGSRTRDHRSRPRQATFR